MNTAFLYNRQFLLAHPSKVSRILSAHTNTAASTLSPIADLNCSGQKGNDIMKSRNASKKLNEHTILWSMWNTVLCCSFTDWVPPPSDASSTSSRLLMRPSPADAARWSKSSSFILYANSNDAEAASATQRRVSETAWAGRTRFAKALIQSDMRTLSWVTNKGYNSVHAFCMTMLGFKIYVEVFEALYSRVDVKGCKGLLHCLHVVREPQYSFSIEVHHIKKNFHLRILLFME